MDDVNSIRNMVGILVWTLASCKNTNLRSLLHYPYSSWRGLDYTVWLPGTHRPVKKQVTYQVQEGVVSAQAQISFLQPYQTLTTYKIDPIRDIPAINIFIKVSHTKEEP